MADIVKGEFLTEDEDIEPSPGTAYGRSKLEAEKYLIQQFALKLNNNDNHDNNDNHNNPFNHNHPSFHLPSSKSLFILRPAMIHGPGNKGNLNLLYKLVSKGIPWPLGAFGNQRSFTSIDNLAFVINQLIEKEIEPGIYNMSDDTPISTNRLIELIAASKGKKAKIWRINPKLISYGARIGGFLHLPLNPERLKKLTESYVVSNLKLKKALGIEKMPVSVEEGMIKTLKSFE